MWRAAKKTCFLADHSPPHPVTWAKNDPGSKSTVPAPPTTSPARLVSKQLSVRPKGPKRRHTAHSTQCGREHTEGQLKPARAVPGIRSEARSPALTPSGQQLLEMPARATRQEKEMKVTRIKKRTRCFITDDRLCTQETQNHLPKAIKIPR